MMFASTARLLIPAKYEKKLDEIRNLYAGYSSVSFSQEGEDLILKRIFDRSKHGFYVDVGAHHPLRFSNTHIFYRMGWNGINIDAMPGSMALFQRMRPRDINLELPIAETAETLTYYAFSEPAFNGFSRELSEERIRRPGCTLVFQKEMQTRTLAEVLEQYLPAGRAIEFLSIDVEGLDFQVLRSNDWSKYRPELVLAEARGTTLEEIFDSEIARYMKANGYTVFARTFNTVFFRRKD